HCLAGLARRSALRPWDGSAIASQASYCARAALIPPLRDLSPAAPRGVRKDFAPGTQRQSFDAYLADGRAYQAKRRKSHLCRHAPYLAVLAFTYRELDPRRRNFRTIADRRISRP